MTQRKITIFYLISDLIDLKKSIQYTVNLTVWLRVCGRAIGEQYKGLGECLTYLDLALPQP